MLTPQEVSTHSFTKAVMGGYNMAMVDEFLDELTDDYAALYKENAALKAKMKVLVEKVEDYRATEDSMRATLLTAQKMADSIVQEAEGKRAELLAKAEGDAREKVSQLQREIEETSARLRQGRQELTDFISATRAVCAKELQFLNALPQLSVEESVPAAPAAPVEEIEEKVMAAFAAQNPEQPAEPAEEPQPETAGEEYPEGDPFANEEVSEPTRRINLSELKFGRNYKGNE